ncbi:2-amino-5-chloromuconate deaminase CnbZ [Acuticoccus kandeliae]|uniref:2-amino-5-chloromuconate deaminase CnbZ n=1 Tax=Acuticoccus kandeliae TaxID=2073160 RepID=UPI000D3E534E|nr:hypothetical protein [Acuticoccus kandeliae]
MSALKTKSSYAYIPGVMQYSAGVAAADGFAIERARFEEPVKLDEGFARIKAHLESIGRPLDAFCACELRSPAPFTEAGFRTFNEAYSSVLVDWGIMEGEDNPVARSNVCPEVAPPSEPSFHAFCYTVPAAGVGPTFVVAGSGEAREGQGTYRDNTVRFGETTPDAIAEKADYVLGEMERRMSFFGAGWADTTAAQLYTVHPIHAFLESEIVRRGAARHGLTWHYNRPPVKDLEYEMDCRRILTERVLLVG